MADLAVCEPEDITVKSIRVNDKGSLEQVKIKCKVDHCDVAAQAIRNALILWDVGWLNLTPQARKGALAIEIMELLSGYTIPYQKKWKKVGKQPWSAQDCMEVLRICKNWSLDGSYGENLIGMAAELPEWPHDPIPEMKRRIHRLRYGG